MRQRTFYPHPQSLELFVHLQKPNWMLSNERKYGWNLAVSLPGVAMCLAGIISLEWRRNKKKNCKNRSCMKRVKREETIGWCVLREEYKARGVNSRFYYSLFLNMAVLCWGYAGPRPVGSRMSKKWDFPCWKTSHRTFFPSLQRFIALWQFLNDVTEKKLVPMRIRNAVTLLKPSCLVLCMSRFW